MLCYNAGNKTKDDLREIKKMNHDFVWSNLFEGN